MGKNQLRQKNLRAAKEENAFLFDNQFNLLAEVKRQEWELAIEMADGDVSKAATGLGLNVPKASRALWGKSSNHALDQYRQWQNRKAKLNKIKTKSLSQTP